jgi:hypothetical protein
MAGKRNTKQNVPLIVEAHPQGYTGYPFITLLQYNQNHILTIVDNADDKNINAFVLDLCGPENVDEEHFVGIAAEWYRNSRDLYPLSIEFSKQGISHETTRIYKTFQTEHITRVIGPLPSFDMGTTVQVKRRKRKPLSSNIQIVKKSFAK